MPNVQRCSGQMVIALIVIIGFFGALYMMAHNPIPPENKDLVNILLGILGGSGFTAVMAYYFGSSIGSRNKENTIEQMSKVNPAPDGPQQPSVVVNNSPVSPPSDLGVATSQTAPQTVNVSVAQPNTTPAAAMSWNGQSVTKKDDGTYVATDGTALKMDEKGNLVPITVTSPGG